MALPTDGLFVAAEPFHHGERLTTSCCACTPQACVERLAGTASQSVMLDPDTFTSPDSFDIALLAAGATVQAAEHAIATREPAFGADDHRFLQAGRGGRRRGARRRSDRAMGFCFFNNVAVAAAAMLDGGLERIAVVDIDVHHGNGTQAIFYEEPRVFYVSTHQFPFYPGTGAADEIGAGDGRGFTVNVPMDAGSTDADYALVHREVVVPILEQFRPGLLLVSAGFDAHEQRDPLASMRMTTDGFGSIVQGLVDVAAHHGSLAMVTEGGYDLSALAACVERSVEVLSGRAPEPRGAGGNNARGVRAVAGAEPISNPTGQLSTACESTSTGGFAAERDRMSLFRRRPSLQPVQGH